MTPHLNMALSLTVLLLSLQFTIIKAFQTPYPSIVMLKSRSFCSGVNLISVTTTLHASKVETNYNDDEATKGGGNKSNMKSSYTIKGTKGVNSNMETNSKSNDFFTKKSANNTMTKKDTTKKQSSINGRVNGDSTSSTLFIKGAKKEKKELASIFQIPKPTEVDKVNGSSGTDEVKTENNFLDSFVLAFNKNNNAKEISIENPIDKLTSTSTPSDTERKSAFNFMDKIKNPFVETKAKAKSTVKLRPGEEIITNDITGFTTTIINSDIRSLFPQEPRDKFTFAQRIESIKTGIVGLFAGGIALTPFSAFHDIIFNDESIRNGIAQWEFDTDTGSLATALFAIVYRYCVRDGEEKNEMLQMGVIFAFVLVRTLARIRVPIYCSAAPLNCGEPFGYFDYNMIQQGIGSGLESIVMFGATALVMEYCYEKGYISRFK